MKYPKILIGIIAKNAEPYLDLLAKHILNITYPKNRLSLAVVENDSEDGTFEKTGNDILPKFHSAGYNFSDVIRQDYGFKLKPEHRHMPQIQSLRLACITKARNFLVDTFLDDHDFLQWFDADYKEIPSDILFKFAFAKKDIIMPAVYTESGLVYDQMTRRYGLPIAELNRAAPQSDFVEVCRVSAPCFVSRKVFDAGVDYSGPPGQQEGENFSIQAEKKGFKMFVSLKTKIIHADIDGLIPLK